MNLKIVNDEIEILYDKSDNGRSILTTFSGIENFNKTFLQQKKEGVCALYRITKGLSNHINSNLSVSHAQIPEYFQLDFSNNNFGTYFNFNIQATKTYELGFWIGFDFNEPKQDNETEQFYFGFNVAHSLSEKQEL